MQKIKEFFHEYWDATACWIFGHHIGMVQRLEYKGKIWYRFECIRKYCKATSNDITEGK